MCHSDDSRPPGPPVEGDVAESSEVTLTAIDGTAFSAYEARPERWNGAGIVILPDVRGLHPFYANLARRFAQAGFDSVAVDYFGRTAGTAPRDADFDWQAHVAEVTPEHVRSDVEAAVQLLRGRGVETIFTVGFCFGGGQSWRLAASDLGLSGTIGFYGRPALLRDVLTDVRSPLLLLVAGADAATPVDEFRALSADLDRAGKVHEMHVYEGAPHSFFDRAFEEWREACEDAWRRIIDFTGR